MILPIETIAWIFGWDPSYLRFLNYVFTPVLIAFLLPILFLAFIYLTSIFLHVYKLRHQLQEAYATSIWDGGRTSIASFWDAHGHIWHGAALIVYYHGILPLDVLYLVAKVILKKGRTIKCVVDNFHFAIPGLQLLCKVAGVTPGNVDDIVEHLKQGKLVCIAPGGVREAMFSDPDLYSLLWEKRVGFAKVALRAKVPVIPMFTENYREAYRTVTYGRKFFRWVYECTRLPLMPVYGGFPVKLITHLGEPLDFSVPLSQLLTTIRQTGDGREDDDDDETTAITPSPSDILSLSPDDVKSDVWQARCLIKEQLEKLIVTHQRLPGSIFKALLARFRTTTTTPLGPRCRLPAQRSTNEVDSPSYTEEASEKSRET